MKLYNTMSMQKEEFVPIEPGKVRMYACGPTVYNYIHVGNARPIIMFDVLRRYLEYRGYEVTFVQNFTDVDDKIIKRANEEGISSEEVAKKYIAEYFTDAHALGVREATVHPKATENIQQIIDLITTLIDKRYAYEVNGDVYYRTLKFKDYGKLSHQPIEDLQSGARIDVNDIKENPLDFALWKAAKPGEPSWDSPWGKGRPGWHIECSAMSNRYLGKTIDIHCGGSDLAFPHHENEIAQSEAANGCKFVNYWLHNGFINIDNKKMSKSLGNCIFLSDTSDEVKQKIRSMYTDPTHIHVNDPGNVEGNTVFTYLDAFCRPEHFERYLPEYPNLDELKNHYRRGGLGDVKIKNFLNAIMEETLEPIRTRRKEFEKDIPAVYDILKKGCDVAREKAADTLSAVRKAMKIDYFDDNALISEQTKRFANE